MKVLGINVHHGDASACIFIDNKLIAAAEEERYDKLKKGITTKVNKLKDMPKSERVKSDDLKVFKSIKYLELNLLRP